MLLLTSAMIHETGSWSTPILWVACNWGSLREESGERATFPATNKFIASVSKLRGGSSRVPRLGPTSSATTTAPTKSLRLSYRLAITYHKSEGISSLPTPRGANALNPEYPNTARNGNLSRGDDAVNLEHHADALCREPERAGADEERLDHILLLHVADAPLADIHPSILLPFCVLETELSHD